MKTDDKSVEIMMGLEEIARRLKVSQRTVLRWIDKKGLPAYKPGRSYLLYWSEVNAWLKEHKYESDNADSG